MGTTRRVGHSFWAETDEIKHYLAAFNNIRPELGNAKLGIESLPGGQWYILLDNATTRQGLLFSANVFAELPEKQEVPESDPFDDGNGQAETVQEYSLSDPVGTNDAGEDDGSDGYEVEEDGEETPNAEISRKLKLVRKASPEKRLAQAAATAPTENIAVTVEEG